MASSALYQKKNEKSGASAFYPEYSIQNTEYRPRELCSRGLPAQAGMTMIESLIWISIFTITMVSLMASVLYFYRTNKYAVEQSGAVTSAQRGIDKLVRTIREASYSSQGAYPVVSIGANDLIFYADVDNDPLIEKVHYYVSGTYLMQGITDATGAPPGYTTAEVVSVISDYVRNLYQGVTTFRYYDTSGAEITNYAQWVQVRFVRVNVVVNVDPNKLPNQLNMNSSAALRNLK